MGIGDGPARSVVRGVACNHAPPTRECIVPLVPPSIQRTSQITGTSQSGAAPSATDLVQSASTEGPRLNSVGGRACRLACFRVVRIAAQEAQMQFEVLVSDRERHHAGRAKRSRLEMASA
jgi:hypothetical protein